MWFEVSEPSTVCVGLYDYILSGTVTLHTSIYSIFKGTAKTKSSEILLI